MIKLNIGCGKENIKGYINVDIESTEWTDKVFDCSTHLPYGNNSIDEIRASHFIEHLTKGEWKIVKKDWYKKLKLGGILDIACPDLEACAKAFLDEKDRDRKWGYCILPIYGDGDWGPGWMHKNGFNLEKLERDLTDEGFKITDRGKVENCGMFMRATK